MAKDVWEIVTGDETLPADASPGERVKFRKRENIALATVCLPVVTGLQIYVRSAVTAKEAWENLEKILRNILKGNRFPKRFITEENGMPPKWIKGLACWST